MKHKRLATALLWAVAAVGAATAAFGSARLYRDYTAKEALRPHVLLATTHVKRMHELASKTSNITYGEYFDRASSAVKELEKVRSDIRLAQPSERMADVAVNYIDASQDLIRNYESFMRKEMQGNSALERADNHRKQASSRAGSYHVEAAMDAIQDAEKIAAEQGKILETQKTLLESLRAKASATRATFGESAVLSDQEIQERIKKS